MKMFKHGRIRRSVPAIVLLGLLLGPITAVSGGPVPSLFKLTKSVDVTPAGNLIGGAFTRIGCVPEKQRIVVTFQARLDQPVAGTTQYFCYVYREFTLDMMPTGKDGIIYTGPGIDYGGLIDGNVFYLAAQVPGGWMLAKYNTITWGTLIPPCFHPLSAEEENADPMLAMVNGKLDVSSTFVKKGEPRGPTESHATHHQFFTPDLKFLDARVLSDIPHIDLNSMIAIGGVTHFVTGTALIGDIIIMQYAPDWHYLGGDIILPDAVCPEGLATDGMRFYVAYLDTQNKFPCYQNVHLAAFDSKWKLIEDVAVTSYVPTDLKQTSRPTLTLWNNNIYVAWDQTDNETFSGGSPADADVQVHVKVYELVLP